MTAFPQHRGPLSAVLQRRGVLASGLTRRGVSPTAWLLGAIVTACAVFGVVAGISPKYAIEGVLGIGFVVVVFSDLALGVGVFAALTFLSDITSGGTALSFDKILGLLLFLSWALRRSTAARDDARTIIGRHPSLFAWLVAFLAWSTISVTWAVSSSVALTYVYHDLLEVLLIPVVYGAINSRRDVYVIIAGFLIGGIVSASYGLANPLPATAAAAGRLSSSAGDPNQTAADLVAALTLAAGLGVVARRSLKLRTLAIVAAVLCLIGIVQTLSRSGLVALGFALLAGVFIGGRWRRAARWVLALGVAGVAGYFFLLAPASSVSRVTSSNADGRNTIWTVGWRMFEANSVLGVGAGNFPNAARQYLERPGLTQSGYLIITTPKVTHNIYLEQMDELGVPGLILMLAVFVGGIIVTLRAAHIFERLGDRELELVSRCTILCVCAFLASDFFISGLQTKQFWLALALGLALFKLARTELDTAG